LRTTGISHHQGLLSSTTASSFCSLWNELNQGSTSRTTRLYALSIQESDAIENLDSSNVWELLGTEEGKLALGVKPEEVLKCIGT
jgi:hypothetical protein